MGKVHRGIHEPLEEAANAILRESLRGVTSMSAKRDILTPWKEQDRRAHEVYNANGFPEPTFQGQYSRVLNRDYPHLNASESFPRPRIRKGDWEI